MEVQEYLENRLRHSTDYELTKEDQRILDAHGVAEFIYRKLMSKKFRKWSLPESVQKKVRAQVAQKVEEQKPILINLSFGGFKLWRLPTTPEVDWSEFFYTAYHLSYLAPIAKVYEPGTHFEFSSADIAVTAMNNVPRSDVDQYDASLKTLIAEFSTHLPENMTLGSSRLREHFKDEAEYIEAGEKLRAGARERFGNDPEYAAEFEHGAEQNVQLIGGTEDLSSKTEAELQSIRTRSSEIIESMYEMPQVLEHYGKGEIEVMATNMELDEAMIVTGTTKRSSAKFWAGLGVLARNGDSFAEYVVTPKQWEAIKDQPHEAVSSDLIPLKNFKEILVYPEKFNFSGGQ